MECYRVAMVCRYKTASDPPVYRFVIEVSLAVCLLPHPSSDTFCYRTPVHPHHAALLLDHNRLGGQYIGRYDRDL